MVINIVFNSTELLLMLNLMILGRQRRKRRERISRISRRCS